MNFKIMNKIVFLFLLCSSFTFGQTKIIKPLNVLINKDEPAWELVSEWIKEATNKIEVLPKNEKQADSALYRTQVSTRSPMGAIIYETGGILVDNGWIRILGSGNKKLNRTLPDWNKGKTFDKYGIQPSFLLIADDIIGGFFALNGGGLGNDLGAVYYFAPDTLKWEPMELGYSDFIRWTFTGDLATFYSNIRWENWEIDVKKVNGDSAFMCFPYLWSKTQKNKVSDKKIVPIHEVWIFEQNTMKQLNLGK